MGKHTEVEIVLHTVSDEQDTNDGVGEGCNFKESVKRPYTYHSTSSELTRSRGVLAAEVAGLVASQKAGALDLRSSTTGETGVEVHDAVHTGSILSSTDRLLFSNVSYRTHQENVV